MRVQMDQAVTETIPNSDRLPVWVTQALSEGWITTLSKKNQSMDDRSLSFVAIVLKRVNGLSLTSYSKLTLLFM